MDSINTSIFFDNLLKNGRFFQSTGGYDERPAFLIWEVLKTLLIRIDLISGSKTFDS